MISYNLFSQHCFLSHFTPQYTQLTCLYTIFTLTHLLPLSLAHLPQQKHHHLTLLFSITKTLLMHTLASFWKKQSCDILLLKTRSVLDQFKNHLNNSCVYIMYNGTKSIQSQVTRGVPKGLILWPLLFLLYVNVLHKVMKNAFLILFAKDSNLFYTGNDMVDMTVIQISLTPRHFEYNHDICVS